MLKMLFLSAMALFMGLSTTHAQNTELLLAANNMPPALLALPTFEKLYDDYATNNHATEAMAIEGYTSDADEKLYASGEIFRFVALNQEGNKAITLDVEYSPDGIATITRSESAAKSNTKRKLGFLAGADHWKYTPVNKDGEAFLEITPNQKHEYYYVYFDNNRIDKVIAGSDQKVKTKIYCPCNCNDRYKEKRIGVVSTPKDMFGFLACEKDDKCGAHCAPQFILENRHASSNSVLIIKAKEVRFK